MFKHALGKPIHACVDRRRRKTRKSRNIARDTPQLLTKPTAKATKLPYASPPNAIPNWTNKCGGSVKRLKLRVESGELILPQSGVVVRSARCSKIKGTDVFFFYFYFAYPGITRLVSGIIRYLALMLMALATVN